jgi:hypothetical protein
MPTCLSPPTRKAQTNLRRGSNKVVGADIDFPVAHAAFPLAA